MSVTPKNVLNKNKDLNKRVDITDINLNGITTDDLKFNGDNYDNYINLLSLLENLSSCQICDAYSEVSRRIGTIKSIKPVNNLKVWGSVFTVTTDSDDWGTSALAIDEASSGDVLFFNVNGNDKAIWGELASKSAKNKGIKAVVVNGAVRDLDALLYLDFPVFTSDFVPNAGLPLGLGSLRESFEIDGVRVNHGDFIFGDETGVVLIPKELFSEVMSSALKIKLKESKIIEDLSDGYSLAQIVGLEKK